MYNLSYQSPQLRVAVIARTHYREVQTKAERNKLHVIEQKVLRHFRPLVAFTFCHNIHTGSFLVFLIPFGSIMVNFY